MNTLKTFTIALLVAFAFSSCSNDDDSGNNTSNFTANLTSLNNSGAEGVANVNVNGNLLTVTINASGMVANQPHPQHIHGLDDGSNGVCPPATADTDNDGIISVPEGAPFYGAILLPLENFPMADANGNVTFTQTFTLGENGTPTAETFGNLENRVIVLHGLENGGSYVPTIPVACGELTRS